MSAVDVFDPSVRQVCADLASSSSSTTWFILHYSTPGYPSPLMPLAKGPDPIVAQLAASIRSYPDEVLFAYGEVANPAAATAAGGYGALGRSTTSSAGGHDAATRGKKGFVLLYLPDSIGGVRRARAVVHCRNVAQLFPDYSALITISRPDELTEGLINDKLDLLCQPRSSPVSRGLPPIPTEEAQAIESLRPLKASSHSSSSRAVSVNSANDSSDAFHTASAGNSTVASIADGYGRPRDTPSPPPPASLGRGPPPAMQNSDHSAVGGANGNTAPIASPLPNAATGVSPTDLFSTPGQSSSTPDKSRKTSLSARLKHALPSGLTGSFGSGSTPSKSSAPSSPKSPMTPKSPGSAENSPRQPSGSHRFKGLTLGFGSKSPSSANANAPSPTGGHMGQHPVLPVAPDAASTPSRATGHTRQVSAAPSTVPVFGGAPDDPMARLSAAASCAAAGAPTGAVPPIAITTAPSPAAPSPERPPRRYGAIFPQAPGTAAPVGHAGSALPTTSDAPVSPAGPPVPPKDDASEVSLPSADPAPATSAAQAAAYPSKMGPTFSPSAEFALAEARTRRLQQEIPLQEQFRRDQAERDRIRRHSGNRQAVIIPSGHTTDGEEDDLGLPYDRPGSTYDASAHIANGHAFADDSANVAPLGGGPHSLLIDSAASTPAVEADPVLAARAQARGIIPTDLTNAGLIAPLAMAPAHFAPEAPIDPVGLTPLETPRTAARQYPDGILAAPPTTSNIGAVDPAPVMSATGAAEVRELSPEEKSAAATESHAQRMDFVRSLSGMDHAQLMAAETAQQAEAERELVQQEIARRAENERVERERAAAEAEARRAEEERLEQERLQAEEAARKAEEERLRLEEEERVRQEAERLRLDEEERARIEEEQRLRREEEARKAEEERLRIEAEEARKRQFREELQRGKATGGIMLNGHITVQTYKNMTWRRRYFHLLPTEMRFFKNESDDKPIVVMSILHGSKVSRSYEDSQVQDSFKVVSVGPSGEEEEFFLFTDSAEEREAVLEGLGVAMVP